MKSNNQSIKICKNCYWIHEFAFFKDWYACLFPEKNKPKAKKSTKLNSLICPFAKKNL